MNTRSVMKPLVAALALFAASLAQAATVWDESVNGDLSNNGLAPTPITLLTGSNDLHGIMGAGVGGIDRDYFTFSLPQGTTLTSLTLLPDTNVAGSVSFIAIQQGPQVTASPDGVGAEALLTFSHFGNDQIGQSLLLFLGLPNGLPSGTYSIWIQETGGTSSYGLDFGVSAVPLPAAVWLLASGVAGLAFWRRRNLAPTSG